MEANFVLVETRKSFCPGCKKAVTLIQSKTGHVTLYVCWTCKRAWQAGKSEIRKEQIR